MAAKLALQTAGLGFGFLPRHCAQAALDAGLLLEKRVEEPRTPETFYLAWRTGEQGAALAWWRDRLLGNGVFERLCKPAE